MASQHLRLGVGHYVKVTPMKSPKGENYFAWEAKLYKDVVGKGACATDKEARTAAAAALIERAHQVAPAAQVRAQAKKDLRDFLPRRPYIIMHVAEKLMLIPGVTRERLIDEAEQEEKAWQRRDPPEFRTPLPTHPAALSPEKAAEKALRLFERGGYVRFDPETETWDTRRLKKWAAEVFEGSEFDPNYKKGGK